MSRRASSTDVVAVRTAVERALEDVAPRSCVLVACSGGPDSLALAGAVAWVGERQGIDVAAVVVDHGLQAGSADVARDAAAACRALGVGQAVVVEVEVGRDGGPEAAARDARYQALERAAHERQAVAVLLGHTRDDQAETVLLRLARGSGARSLSGMQPRRGLFRRPLLDLPRAAVRGCALELLEPLGLAPWIDPHNDDPRFARARVRAALAELETTLGPGAVLGLARSAELLGDDADALDAWADGAFERLVSVGPTVVDADCDGLAELPRGVRTRVVRRMCIVAGCPSDQVGIEQIRAVDALVSDWRGQGAVSLPAGVVADRAYGRLCLRVNPPTGAMSGA